MDETVNQVSDNPIVEMGLVITKAAFDKAEPNPDRKRRITLTNSDTLPDLYEESMSLELFKDFTDRIANNTPIPDVFKSVVCEGDVWCGGMPYLSIAHYRAGENGKNLSGDVDSVYVDGKQLKSKAFLRDNNLGRRTFDAICLDEEKRKSRVEDHEPVRVSIGFLDLEHEHITEGKSFTFTRTGLGQICPLCSQGVGGKIYKKGQLVHLAATRKPVNPRTSMSLEEKSMGEIITKKDDAASIVGDDLAQELDERSLVSSDILVIKSDEVGTHPTPQPTPFAGCYDPNTDSFSQECIDASMRGFMASIRNEMTTVKSETVDKLFDEVSKSLNKLQGKPVVEESMDKIEKAKEEAKDEKEVEDSKKADGVKEYSAVAPAPSALDTEFEKLKSAVVSGKATREQLQEVFNSLGKAVEEVYVAPAPSAGDIAAIVKSAVEDAIRPLAIKVAQMEAQKSDTVSRSMQNPISRALTLTPEQLIQKSQPTKQLTQIERIAKASTGASL